MGDPKNCNTEKHKTKKETENKQPSSEKSILLCCTLTSQHAVLLLLSTGVVSASHWLENQMCGIRFFVFFSTPSSSHRTVNIFSSSRFTGYKLHPQANDPFACSKNVAPFPETRSCPLRLAPRSYSNEEMATYIFLVFVFRQKSHFEPLDSRKRN